jgi:hypothetical protein
MIPDNQALRRFSFREHGGGGGVQAMRTTVALSVHLSVQPYVPANVGQHPVVLQVAKRRAQFGPVQLAMCVWHDTFVCALAVSLRVMEKPAAAIANDNRRRRIDYLHECFKLLRNQFERAIHSLSDGLPLQRFARRTQMLLGFALPSALSFMSQNFLWVAHGTALAKVVVVARNMALMKQDRPTRRMTVSLG